MNPSPTIAAAEHFLSTVWDGEPPSDEALLRALDRLVAAYHETPIGDVSDAEIDAPRQDGAFLYRQLAARFPAYGYYPAADPAKPLEEALMMADAIDDLADLTLDMREVTWFAEQVGINDAHLPFGSITSTGGSTLGSFPSSCAVGSGGECPQVSR
jgi:hypothetical protein